MPDRPACTLVPHRPPGLARRLRRLLPESPSHNSCQNTGWDPSMADDEVTRPPDPPSKPDNSAAGPIPGALGSESPDSNARRGDETQEKVSETGVSPPADTPIQQPQQDENHGSSAKASSVRNRPPRASTRHWRRRGALYLTGIGAVAGAVSVIVAILAWLGPKSPPPTAAAVSITSIGVDRLQPVDSEVRAGTDDFTVERKGQSAIDIAFHNKGGSPALIESVDVRFDYARELENCNPGHGPLKITGKYDVRVPVNITTEHFTLTRRMLFQVPPNAFDRLALLVGPQQTASGDHPWLYGISVTVHFRDHPAITTGRVGLVSPAADIILAVRDARENTVTNPACVNRNYQLLFGLMQSGGLMSDKVKSLVWEYARDFDALRFPDSATDPGPWQAVDWSSVSPEERCTIRGLRTISRLVVMSDVSRDGKPDALVALSCEGSASDIPDQLRAFDGASDPRHPRLLGTLLSTKDGIDESGLHIQSIIAGSGRVIVTSSGHGVIDPSSPPQNVVVVDAFDWTTAGFSRSVDRVVHG
jgi:hypothetical protein